MRILVLTRDFPRWDGGIAVYGEKLAKFLHAAGHQVTVVTPRQLPGDDEFDAAQSYRVVRLRNVKDHVAKYYYGRWKLRDFLRRETFDQILATTWYPFANAALRYAPETPLTLFAFGNDFSEPRWQRPFWRRRMERAFAGARHVITISRESERALDECFPGIQKKMHLLFPGIDPSEFPEETSAPRQPPVLLTLGRVVERKGQDMVVRALPKILAEFPRVEYWIAGRGAYLAQVQKLATELNVEKSVRFLGFVSAEERLQLYQQCSIYLMPARSIPDKGDFEGFGITFLEANMCGRPVIGGRAGGVLDAVDDRVSGFLVDPEYPTEIADRAIELLRDPALAAKLGRQGRERALREFTWSQIVRQLERLF